MVSLFADYFANGSNAYQKATCYLTCFMLRLLTFASLVVHALLS